MSGFKELRERYARHVEPISASAFDAFQTQLEKRGWAVQISRSSDKLYYFDHKRGKSLWVALDEKAELGWGFHLGPNNSR
eukprot:CAMPEP_0167789666 /NCGR_PEP_ID=MMETSP0111_2-20121227/10828_1 /TAXON_ID=91324 /ORGANISM="Lotharella globosa, Strain CCCM811" /LENGTH=79 /DNA_ID=CAMNT_0007681891 /DNA_START=646 /DNA_END=882 /DNA_ORIENTATION=-